ncbi:MAG: hypothetical protein WDO69_06335 [Pseudomonadota bacterium]
MTARRAAGASLACLACSLAFIACGSPFRGGYAVPEAPLPDTKTLARFIPGHCEDATHAEHAPRFSSIDLIETSTGRTLLLEHRQGHELLVAENFHDDGSFWVFEVVVPGQRVRRWRIPRSSLATGTLEVGRELTEVSHGERFQVGLASSHLTCTLVARRNERASEH